MYRPISIFRPNVNIYEGSGEESAMVTISKLRDWNRRETHWWSGFSGCSEEVDMLTV